MKTQWVHLGRVWWAAVAAGLMAYAASAEDWPTYQHDNRRSACSAENLPTVELAPAWVYRSPLPPQPAWDGAAKWDAYAGIRPLKSMRDYDPVFHVVVAGTSVFFGSSVDDGLHCLDACTGNERWTYTTDGAIRIAPTWSEGRVYFGSDDGFAYCLAAEDGRLLWKYRPSPEERQVVHNGRFIPFWPCRTGVLVDGDTAYFATSLLPWKPSFLCAVDVLTGQPTGPGRYVRAHAGVTFEGSLLASNQRLISPQGRVPPRLFDRREGSALGALPGGGGCFVLLTPDARVFYGPGNKTGWIQESGEPDRAKIATFNGANALVVREPYAYILSDTNLLALHRRTRKEAWSQPSAYPFALIAAGDTLYAGGDGRVGAFRASDGQRVWEGTVTGRAYGLAVASGRLFVSTDKGTIHTFATNPSAAASNPPSAVSPAAAGLSEAKQMPPDGKLSTAEHPYPLACGPWLEFVDSERAVVSWQTRVPVPTGMRWGPLGLASARVGSTEPTTNHTAILSGLEYNRAYVYALTAEVEGRTVESPVYECDTFFNYSPRPLPAAREALATESEAATAAATARELIEASGVSRGLCLLWGLSDAALAEQLARRSGLQVLGVDPREAEVQAQRERLKRAGIYGGRLTLHPLPPGDDLPFVGSFANLIVWTRSSVRPTPPPPALLVRYLRPYGGQAWLEATLEAWEQDAALSSWVKAARELDGARLERRGRWVRWSRGTPPGAADWTHEYGDAANAAFSGERLGDARGANDLEVQWLGKPGPRAQADRNGRKPSPLSTQGRLFMQGLHRILALDAFNGTILWTREIPDFERFNLPRDCSNWCADEQTLYLAVRDRCWLIEAATGRLLRQVPVASGAGEGERRDWGYLSIQGDRLVGTAVRPGTAYTEYWGGADAGWYDATSGPVTYKVGSEALFALDPRSDRLLWRYAKGRILHSTITIAGGRVWFLVSRHPKVLAHPSDRLGLPELWEDLSLVALSLDEGRTLWDRRVRPASGEVAVYLAQSSDKLVLVCSGKKEFHVDAFDSGSGEPAWTAAFPWPKDNHGAHMSRPAIVGGKVYVRPRAFDLATGRTLEETVPSGGCGTYAASAKALFFRDGNVTVWGLEDHRVSGWERLRPDCWLSTIPAQGLLLSPEAGGGCSCGSWLETSMAFAPKL